MFVTSWCSDDWSVDVDEDEDLTDVREWLRAEMKKSLDEEIDKFLHLVINGPSEELEAYFKEMGM